MTAQVTASSIIISDFIALTKPRIISLLLVTSLGGMFLAARGSPDPFLALMVLVGGAMAAGGAHSLNHYLERDIDGMMRRTWRRPVVTGRVLPRHALVFGICLNAASFVLLATQVNLLSAVLTMSGTLFYVFVYTLALKRTTPQSIVIGGAAGAVPPMVGWAAVTGGIDLPALYLFTIVFLWTPPHFWALAILIKDDYARAGIPMLPVVTSVERTKLSIELYTVALVAATLLFALSQAVGWVYFLSSLGLGVVFLYRAHTHRRKQGAGATRALYLYSLLYLALLFLAMILDSMVPM